jgi:hypothetical protein
VKSAKTVVIPDVDDDKPEIQYIVGKKYNHTCPFCMHSIPKIYSIETRIKHKHGKVKTKIVKTAVGENWSEHTESCKQLSNFLNQTKS